MKYTLYKVDNNKRSSVRGYWLDNGKLYKDNIKLVKYNRRDKLWQGIRALFRQGEQAVFYRGDNGYCIDKEGNRQVYRNRLLYKRSKLSAQKIKRLLKDYGGLTIYNCKKTRGLYFIEIYTK